MSLLEEGIKFHQKGLTDKAQTIYENILVKDPINFAALEFLGIIFFQKREYEKSLKYINKSISINPKNSRAYNNCGNIFLELKEYDKAIKNYKTAIDLNPNYAGAFYNLGMANKIISKFDIALNYYKNCIELDPNFLDAYYDCAEVFERIGNNEEALKYYEKLERLSADYPLLQSSIIHLKLKICDWKNIEQNIKKIKKDITQNKIINPYHNLLISSSAELQQIAIKNYAQFRFPDINVNYNNSIKSEREKIKIGYYSSDFRNHAVGRSIVRLFECHNKKDFEIFGFYFGKINDSNTTRISKQCKKFINTYSMADADVVKLSRNMEIDIAIDVNGFSRNCRPKIFSGRSAPIQINYLGYLGTMGVNYIDYIIADKYTIPKKNKNFYNEKIIYLPNSFLPGDELRAISNKNYTRKDFGLPEDKFIFCCFNNIIKINPEIFSLWMEILKTNEKSVLWLFSENKIAINNLKTEAKNRGIDEKRLIFAKKLPYDEYLKSFKLADLFLDTIPYNAGATAMDSLYAGLPILTMSGDSFMSRTSGSLVNTLNMQELIVNSFDDYKNLASSIYKNNKIDEIKSKLKKQISDSSLFNSMIYTKNIEDAFFQITRAYKKNLKNDDIYIK